MINNYFTDSDAIGDNFNVVFEDAFCFDLSCAFSNSFIATSEN